MKDLDYWSRTKGVVILPTIYAPLENSLVTFVKEMPHFVALCLAGLGIDFNSVVKLQWLEEVIPERSAGTLLHDSNGV